MSGEVPASGVKPSDPPRAVVRLDHAHVRAGGESLDERPVALGDDHVRRPARLVGHVPRLEQRPDRRLGPRGVPSERAVDVPAAGVLVSNRVRRAQVGLVAQVDDERGVASRPAVSRRTRASIFVAAVTGSGPTDHERDTDDRDGERGGDSDSAGHEPSLQDQEALSHIAPARRSARPGEENRRLQWPSALLAQLVEHLHGKEGVSGSSPEEGSLESPGNRRF